MCGSVCHQTTGAERLVSAIEEGAGGTWVGTPDGPRRRGMPSIAGRGESEYTVEFAKELMYRVRSTQA
jgi:hypothetical protein